MVIFEFSYSSLPSSWTTFIMRSFPSSSIWLPWNTVCNIKKNANFLLFTSFQIMRWFPNLFSWDALLWMHEFKNIWCIFIPCNYFISLCLYVLMARAASSFCTWRLLDTIQTVSDSILTFWYESSSWIFLTPAVSPKSPNFFTEKYI